MCFVFGFTTVPRHNTKQKIVSSFGLCHPYNYLLHTCGRLTQVLDTIIARSGQATINKTIIYSMIGHRLNTILLLLLLLLDDAPQLPLAAEAASAYTRIPIIAVCHIYFDCTRRQHPDSWGLTMSACGMGWWYDERTIRAFRECYGEFNSDSFRFWIAAADVCQWCT